MAASNTQTLMEDYKITQHNNKNNKTNHKKYDIIKETQ